MRIDQELDKLRNLKKVEPPDFLFTRIRERIRSLGEAPAPLRWKLAFAASAMLLLFLNLGILLRPEKNPRTSQLNQVVRTLQLSTSNELYHE